MKKRVLFSSTRGWNPGDDIVLMGTKNILREAGCDFIPILYNRHPLLVGQIKDYFERPDAFDNSFMLGTGEYIDYIILAGTPGWSGAEMQELWFTALEQGIRGSALGLGGPNRLGVKGNMFFREHLDLLTVRDDTAERDLKKYGAVALPCPGIFSNGCFTGGCRTFKLERVALSFQTPWVSCGPDTRIQNLLLLEYRELIKRYDVTLMCHVYPDFINAQQSLPHAEAFYSDDPKEYVKKYGEFDLVIGTRVHGAACAVAWGAPSIYVQHDFRSGAANLFGSEVVDANEVCASVQNAARNMQQRIDEARELKNSARKRYVELIKKGVKL